MKKQKLLLIALLTLALQGCFFIAGAAAGAAAITIVYDHRTVDSILQDQRIDREVLRKIADNPELHSSTHISVTSFGQVVLLTGEAPTPELRKQVEATAWTVKGITRIYNAITIQGPTSTLTHASDTWITTKIKTEMLATKGLKPASIKVVTENGTVYLMGTVTPAQEATVVNIARHTAGVQKVVKIFQYTEEKPPQNTTQNEAPVQDANQRDQQLSSSVQTHPLESEPLVQEDAQILKDAT